MDRIPSPPADTVLPTSPCRTSWLSVGTSRHPPHANPRPALAVTGSQTDDAPTEPHRQLLHVLPMCDDLDPYGATSDLSSPRRLCDCIMCTSHLLYLSRASHTAAEVCRTASVCASAAGAPAELQRPPPPSGRHHPTARLRARRL